jgi:hypothetical protein
LPAPAYDLAQQVNQGAVLVASRNKRYGGQVQTGVVLGIKVRLGSPRLGYRLDVDQLAMLRADDVLREARVSERTELHRETDEGERDASRAATPSCSAFLHGARGSRNCWLPVNPAGGCRWTWSLRRQSHAAGLNRMPDPRLRTESSPSHQAQSLLANSESAIREVPYVSGNSGLS